MKENKGKKILKSIRFKDKALITLFLILGISFGFLFFLSVPYLIIQPLGNYSLSSIISAFLIVGMCLFLFIYSAWRFLNLYIPYITIYEKGILIRDPTEGKPLRKRKLIPFTQINDIDLINRISNVFLRILIEGQEPYLVNTTFIINSRKIIQLISNKLIK